MTIHEQVVNIVSRHVGRDVSSDDALLGAGLLDSFALVVLTLEIESAFAIKVPPSEINAENFGNTQGIAAMVQRHMGSAPR